MQTSLKVIKLSAIDSTNDYLKSLCKKVDLREGALVVADEQTQGRGQMKAHWYSEKGKSLSFSVFWPISRFEVRNQMAINWAVSLGVLKALQSLYISNLTIKWPNDILAGGKKICGILIENQLQGSQITSSIIGIGVNVNNVHFPDLPQASSLLLQSGKVFNLEEVLQQLVNGITSELETLDISRPETLKKRYEQHLFRKNCVSVFQTPDGNQWNGIIRGVSDAGELLLQREDETIQGFDLKKITLLY